MITGGAGHAVYLLWLAIGMALLPMPSRAVRGAARHRRGRCGAGRSFAWAVVAGVAVMVLMLLSGGIAAILAPVVGLGAAGAFGRVHSRRGPSRPEPAVIAFALDLVSSMLVAGSTPDQALIEPAAAAELAGWSELLAAASPLARIGRLLQLGADPNVAWGQLAPVPGYEAVAVAGSRCAHSGAQLAATLSRTATELRAAARAGALRRAHQVGVWSLLPLGLCFLPAFICIGVVPVVAGVAGQVLANVPG